MACDAQVDKLL